MFQGLLAVVFRQTNIIWVAFVAVQCIGPYFIHTIHCAQVEQTNQQSPAKFSLTTTGQTWEVKLFLIPVNRKGKHQVYIQILIRKRVILLIFSFY